jgi:hypothetical protein
MDTSMDPRANSSSHQVSQRETAPALAEPIVLGENIVKTQLTIISNWRALAWLAVLSALVQTVPIAVTYVFPRLPHETAPFNLIRWASEYYAMMSGRRPLGVDVSDEIIANFANTAPDKLVYLGTVLLVAIVVTLLSTWLQLAAMHVVEDGLSTKSAIAVAGRRLGWYLPTMLLVWLVLLSGTVALLIPGLIFMVWFYFTDWVYVSENKRLWPALQQSRQYVVGRWWSVAMRLLVMSLLIGILTGAWTIISSLLISFPVVGVELFTFSVSFGGVAGSLVLMTAMYHLCTSLRTLRASSSRREQLA